MTENWPKNGSFHKPTLRFWRSWIFCGSTRSWIQQWNSRNYGRSPKILAFLMTLWCLQISNLQKSVKKWAFNQKLEKIRYDFGTKNIKVCMKTCLVLCEKSISQKLFFLQSKCNFTILENPVWPHETLKSHLLFQTLVYNAIWKIHL